MILAILKASAAAIPPQLAALDLQAAINGRVLLWSLAVAAAAGLLVGILPAIQATRTEPHESLKADGAPGPDGPAPVCGRCSSSRRLRCRSCSCSAPAC